MSENGHANPAVVARANALVEQVFEKQEKELKYAYDKILTEAAVDFSQLLSTGFDVWDFQQDMAPDNWGSYPYFVPPLYRQSQKRGEVIPVYVNEYQLKFLRDRSRKLCMENPFAIAALENRVNYVAGEDGFKIKTILAPGIKQDPEAKRLVDRAQKVIDRWYEYNDLPIIQEWLIQQPDITGDGLVRDYALDNGLLVHRPVQSELLRSPVGDAYGPHYSFGIQTLSKDVLTVEGYWVIEDPIHSQAPTFVPRKEMSHVKRNTAWDAKRGMPLFYSCELLLRAAMELLRGVVTTANVRARFSVIRKYTNNVVKDAVAKMRNELMNFSLVDPVTGEARNVQKVPFGSITDASQNVEYEFPHSDLDSGAYEMALQMVLRACAARCNMPEWMFTADASNSNYSNSLVAEAPSTKAFGKLQKQLCKVVGENRTKGRESLAWRQIVHAVRCRILDPDTLKVVALSCEGPTIVVRDKAGEASVNSMYMQARIKPPQMIQQELGIDTDKAKKQFEEWDQWQAETQAKQMAQQQAMGMPPPGAPGSQPTDANGQNDPNAEGGAENSPEASQGPGNTLPPGWLGQPSGALGSRNPLGEATEQLPGGLGDGRPDSDFDPEQLAAGIKVEMEHTNDPAKAKEIAKDHLTEDKDYYKKLKKIEEAYGPHEYSSTQLTLVRGDYEDRQGSPVPKILEMAMRIPDGALAGCGREGEPHITVKYGLLTDNPAKVAEIVQEKWLKPVTVKLGKTTIFPGEQHDVVKVDVDSDDLHELNELLCKHLKHKDTHPVYRPHVTVAYVKSGLGRNFVGWNGVNGMKLTFSEMQFSDCDGNRTNISLVRKSDVLGDDGHDYTGQVVDKKLMEAELLEAAKKKGKFTGVVHVKPTGKRKGYDLYYINGDPVAHTYWKQASAEVKAGHEIHHIEHPKEDASNVELRAHAVDWAEKMMRQREEEEMARKLEKELKPTKKREKAAAQARSEFEKALDQAVADKDIVDYEREMLAPPVKVDLKSRREQFEDELDKLVDEEERKKWNDAWSTLVNAGEVSYPPISTVLSGGTATVGAMAADWYKEALNYDDLYSTFAGFGLTPKEPRTEQEAQERAARLQAFAQQEAEESRRYKKETWERIAQRALEAGKVPPHPDDEEEVLDKYARGAKKVIAAADWVVNNERTQSAIQNYSSGLVYRVALERGATPQAAAETARWLVMIDDFYAWGLSDKVAALLGEKMQGSVGEPLGQVLGIVAKAFPVAQMAYVAWSVARNPLKTLRAIRNTSEAVAVQKYGRIPINPSPQGTRLPTNRRELQSFHKVKSSMDRLYISKYAPGKTSLDYDDELRKALSELEASGADWIVFKLPDTESPGVQLNAGQLKAIIGYNEFLKRKLVSAPEGEVRSRAGGSPFDYQPKAAIFNPNTGIGNPYLPDAGLGTPSEPSIYQQPKELWTPQGGSDFGAADLGSDAVYWDGALEKNWKRYAKAKWAQFERAGVLPTKATPVTAKNPTGVKNVGPKYHFKAILNTMRLLRKKADDLRRKGEPAPDNPDLRDYENEFRDHLLNGPTAETGAIALPGLGNVVVNRRQIEKIVDWFDMDRQSGGGFAEAAVTETEATSLLEALVEQNLVEAGFSGTVHVPATHNRKGYDVQYVDGKPVGRHANSAPTLKMTMKASHGLADKRTGDEFAGMFASSVKNQAFQNQPTAAKPKSSSSISWGKQQVANWNNIQAKHAARIAALTSVRELGREEFHKLLLEELRFSSRTSEQAYLNIGLLEAFRQNLSDKGIDAKLYEVQAETKRLAGIPAPKPPDKLPSLNYQKEHLELAKMLQTAKILDVKSNSAASGSSETRILTLDDGTEAVWKPEIGQLEGLRVCVNGPTQAWQREINAAQIGHAAGLEKLIPVTVPRVVEGQIGSVQAWAKDTKEAARLTRSKRFDGPEDLAKSAALDYALGNTDRHGGNWLVTNKDQLVLIDHGLCFPDSNNTSARGSCHLYNQARANDLPVPNLFPDAVEDTVDEISKNLSDKEKRAMVQRIAYLNRAVRDDSTFASSFLDIPVLF